MLPSMNNVLSTMNNIVNNEVQQSLHAMLLHHCPTMNVATAC